MLHEYVTSVDDDMRRAGHVTYGVADRWHLGQAVYPLLYPRGRRLLTNSERLWIEMALYARGAFMIGAMDDPHRIKQRIEEDTDSYLRPEHAEQCHFLFDRLFKDSLLDVISYNESEEFNIEELSIMAGYGEQRTRYLSDDLVIGNPFNPALMLVGDQVNDEDASEFKLPFAPVAGSSGDFLMDAIYRNWPREGLKHVLIVNSRRPDGTHEDLVRINRLAGSPPIVALGRKAQQVLERQALVHGVVPHPQWVRRFRYHDKNRYAQSIGQASEMGIDTFMDWKGAPE